ncbi:hypothetical protein CFP56_002032 [Quercus suber]|uniref:Uncharacterized protein n=1 Tax=Quercus suber TaxID=58331 RepID=A0AAW0IL25_QUESU
MVREYWREVVPRDASGNGESLSSEVVFIIWGALVMLSLITAAIFSWQMVHPKTKPQQPTMMLMVLLVLPAVVELAQNIELDYVAVELY